MHAIRESIVLQFPAGKMRWQKKHYRIGMTGSNAHMKRGHIHVQLEECDRSALLADVMRMHAGTH